MVDFLRDFIHVLRSSDIKISTAETIDAMRVVSLIGIDDKPLLQDSLSQTLAKNLREKEIFDECFNKFFEENYMNIADESNNPDIKQADLDNQENSEKLNDSKSADLEDLYKQSDKNTLMTLMAIAAREVNIADIRLFTQTGMFTRKIFDAIGLEKLNNDIFFPLWSISNTLFLFSVGSNISTKSLSFIDILFMLSKVYKKTESFSIFVKN